VPFFEITLETANKFYEWGWRASIAGAVITAVGVILLMYGTRVRDRDTESQLISAKLVTAQTSEKAAALQVRAEELKGENLKLSAEILQLQTRQEYSNVARYDALGLLGLAGVGLTEKSPLNDIFGRYVHNDPKEFRFDCTPDAVNAYTAAIKLESKLPFPYYYRGACNMLNNVEGWQHDFDTAREILAITTQIPTHHVNHDQVLKLMDNP
jgi:hypothetical protein